MSPRNKSSQWILGIFCCSLLLSTASVGWGQEYLDRSEDSPSSGSTSLSDRLLSLKNKFSRDDNSQTNRGAAKASQRANPRVSRYRKPAGKSSQAQSGQPTNSSQASRLPVSSGVVSRSKNSDPSPTSQVFSRGDQSLRERPNTKTTVPKAKQLARAASLPRAGSVQSDPKPLEVARKSPITSRANELDAALADLLKTKSMLKRATAPVTSIKPPAVPSPKPSAAVVSNTFDLREALRDDEPDTIASEVAKAVDPTVAQPTAIEAPAEKAETVQAAPAVVTQRPVARVDAPTALSAPEPELTLPVVTKPASTESVAPSPTVPSPTVVVPTFVAAPPKQGITIAKPRLSPPISASSSQKFDIDPFESRGPQVFDAAQPTSNPMRPFLPSFQQEMPVETLARPESSVLQTTQQAVIVSHVEGPRTILVGREATYQVTLENTSNTRASNLSAEVNVPEWAELVDAMSTSGVVTRRTQGANAGALEWKLSELQPRSSQALRLRLIPRTGRPLQLDVQWSQAPTQSQVIVEVQEPKLELAISGPQEVRFGKAQRYRLTLRNPGTGLTEQVSLRLIPPGGDAQSATTQRIGDLKPGEVKDIDLELTAREAGELLIQANATASGGLTAETTKSVLCRKPELKVDWRGPDKRYAGTEAAYYFRVQNPGTAATEPVDMRVKLPTGAEFVSASEGYSINTTTGIVSWRLAGIDVNEEQFMRLRCKIARPGLNDFELIAQTADGELSDTKAFQTDVVALADLSLEVTDPQGPLPLGESVTYEIRVRNRGTTDAENINVVGLFSEGIDPTTVEGAQYTVRDGRVSFHPIKTLPAGREVLLRINAKATRVGTHNFRTEVTCPKLDIKLAAEETTRFFEDEHSWQDGETPYSAERDSTSKR